MKTMRLYDDSLGQFSRDFFSKDHDLYDGGTDNNTVEIVFNQPQWKKIGGHPALSDSAFVFYYFKDPEGILVKATRGLCNVFIDAFFPDNLLENAVKSEFDKLRVNNSQ